MTRSRVLELTRELVARPSITPDDAGCQKLIADRLLPLGFEAEWFLCGAVTNVLLTVGRGHPSVWFLGHTDVVPPGAEALWQSPPFEPVERGGRLFGRGVADMKGAVAAMVVAAEDFVTDAGRVGERSAGNGGGPVSPQAKKRRRNAAAREPDGRPDNAVEHSRFSRATAARAKEGKRDAFDAGKGQIGLLLTSDEEGEAVDGIARVADVLREREAAPDFCLVGEPSSDSLLGDTGRIGRRGSIHARLRVIGRQGHTAFPEALDNPVHRLAPFLAELVATVWDRGDGEFPPTGCQVASIRAGQGARNVTPADATVQFNLRHCPESGSADLRERVRAMIRRHGIEDHTLDWDVMGEPFRSEPGPLRAAVAATCRELLGVTPDLNTGGGTSDGRFIAPLGTEVVELGLVNASIHQVDENVLIADLDRLSAAYLDILGRLLA